ncbi:MAG TPA: hypothetical protein VNP92_14665 [Actinophytocola sp.]|nr:hypothetical protein [Actinophytocola sp.]
MSDEQADPDTLQRIAANLHAEALAALSRTRENQVEITSVRQLRVAEDAAWRILSMRLTDPTLNAAAAAMQERVTVARQWTWVNRSAATGLAIVAVLVGLGAAVIGGTSDNIVLAVLGGLLGSVLLGAVVLRYRRENWRIRAEQIAPMIWQPGI